MSSVNALLSKRLQKTEKSSKMSEMARQSASGNLTTFSGMFSVAELNDGEKDLLEAILYEYSTGKQDTASDLSSLLSITSEIKAINNQACILHGERIKRAQEVLKNYKDGAFTTWMIAAYGNRQTPYNFLQYYEFYNAIPKTLRPQVELMPRQAIYTLASRVGSLTKKKKIIENYRGETKSQVLSLIREAFPLDSEDKRRENLTQGVNNLLKRALLTAQNPRCKIKKTERKNLLSLLDQLYEIVENK